MDDFDDEFMVEINDVYWLIVCCDVMNYYNWWKKTYILLIYILEILCFYSFGGFPFHRLSKALNLALEAVRMETNEGGDVKARGFFMAFRLDFIAV